MATEETKNPPPADPSLQQAEVADVAQFFQQYGRPILLAVGVAVAAYLAVTVYQHRQAQARADADRMLDTGDADQLRALIAQYPNTVAAAAAELRLAREAYDRAEYAAALPLYENFASRRPDHPMALTAKLNGAICLEALGRTGDARAAYQAFAQAHPDHFLAAQARFGEARCLEQEGQYAEARALYENFRAEQPDSPWNQVAEMTVKSLDMKIRAARAEMNTPAPEKTPAVPAAPTAPAAEPAAPPAEG